MQKRDLKKILRFLLVLLLVFIPACSFSGKVNKNASVPSELSPEALKKIINEKDKNYFLIDVRTPAEYKGGYIPSAMLIPYNEIEKHTQEIPRDKIVVLYCHSGRRSGIALEKLKSLGYEKLINFGGITRWNYPLEK